MNIKKTVSDFRKSVSINSDNEIKLFRALAKSICKNSRNSFFIDETHGNKAQVSFTSNIKGVQKCEISDLLIISKKHNQYKATFWQAKKTVKTNWPPPHGDRNFDFIAQFNQWELLSQRPIISGSGNFKPNKDVLNKAVTPSIGSFGVFYEENGLTELNYSVAEMVSSSSIRANPRMIINEKLSQYSAWDNDVIVASNITSFLEALDNFRIGSRLFTSQSDQWLMNYASSKCSANNINGFIDGDIDRTEIDFPDGKDGLSMLLINTEGN